MKKKKSTFIGRVVTVLVCVIVVGGACLGGYKLINKGLGELGQKIENLTKIPVERIELDQKNIVFEP